MIHLTNLKKQANMLYDNIILYLTSSMLMLWNGIRMTGRMIHCRENSWYHHFHSAWESIHLRAILQRNVSSTSQENQIWICTAFWCEKQFSSHAMLWRKKC